MTNIKRVEFFQKNSRVHFFNHKRNEIFEALKVYAVDGKHRRYKSNWLRHVGRMNNNIAKNITELYIK